MKFNVDKTFDLLEGDFYQAKITRNNFEIFVSIFYESSYNIIIPKRALTNTDLLEIISLLRPYRNEGYAFSLYIPEYLLRAQKKIISGKDIDYNDRFVYLYSKKPYKLVDNEIVEVNGRNIGQFKSLAEVCFPKWNNNDFIDWCYRSPNVNLVGLSQSQKIVAFGAYFTRLESDYVLLLNGATDPDHRRKGYHDYLTKWRINEVLKEKGSALFYANVDDEGASHKSLLKKGFTNGPIYFAFPL